jgi:hypothetical protein
LPTLSFRKTDFVFVGAGIYCSLGASQEFVLFSRRKK